jgi:hypothetical protein
MSPGMAESRALAFTQNGYFPGLDAPRIAGYVINLQHTDSFNAESP